MLVPTLSDVVFVFGTRCDSSAAVVTRELWASRSDLEAYEYWRTLLASDFAEASVGELEPAGQPRKRADETVGEVVDSDDETDAVLPAPARHPARPPAHVIRVNDAAFTTYRAVLYYILTSTIAFAPLASRGQDARNSAISTAIQQTTSPPPVSPRSVYRLADKLDLRSLKVRETSR